MELSRFLDQTQLCWAVVGAESVQVFVVATVSTINELLPVSFTLPECWNLGFV